MLYVEKGQAMVFTTDLNANNKVDFNEITGIAAGNGLRMTSFVDINGDISTNLTPEGRLTDSDGDATNGYDGKIVLNNRIESIVLRSIVQEDLDSSIIGNTVANRIAKSTYSVNGNIYAGGGLGLPGVSGVQIDTSGFAAQAAKFGGPLTILGEDTTPIPAVGFIFTGTAVSGEFFSFGTSPTYGDGPAESLRGQIAPFLPAASQAAGDVHGIRAFGSTGGLAAQPVDFHLAGVVTGNGGFGARGGDIFDIEIRGDIGGLLLKTGHGGDGLAGGNGGNITNLAIDASVNSEVKIITGDGGAGLSGRAGLAGNVVFNGAVDIFGRITVGLGKGGDALGNAGAGTSISNTTFNNINPGTYEPAGIVSTWRAAGDIGDQSLVNPVNPAGGYQTNQIDFDGDGFNETVVMTHKPDQLFVAFGAPGGSLDTGRAYFLPSPSYASADIRTSATVVLDAGGAIDDRSFVNGLPNPNFGNPLLDIVSGQSTGDGFSGVLTYVNRGFDKVTGEWLGFNVPRYSPLPGGDAGVLWASFVRDTPQAIMNLVAGDFDRNGVMDIGVVSMVRTPVEPGAATRAFTYSAMVGVMSGLTGSDGKPDGFFAVNYGKGTGQVATSNPTFHFGRGDDPDFAFVLKASAADALNPLSDRMAVIGKGGLGVPSPTAILDKGKDFVTLNLSPVPGVYPNGQLVLAVANAVDTTGLPIAPDLLYSQRITEGDPLQFTGYKNSPPSKIRAADFVFADVNLDGLFDAIVVGRAVDENATPYLVAATLQGRTDPLAGIVIEQRQQTDTANNLTKDDEYFGIALTEFRSAQVNVPSVLSRDFTEVPILRMVAGNFDNNPLTADFALNGIDLLDRTPPPASQMAFFVVTGFGQYGPTSASIDDEFTRLIIPLGSGGYSPFGDTDTAFHTSFFGYYATGPIFTAGIYNALAPVGTYYAVSPASAFTGTDPLLPIAATKLSVSAGAGGWSLLGGGGPGGTIGGASASSSFGTSSNLVLATGYPETSFKSGAGGFGFLSGGRSGSISGVESTVFTARLAPVGIFMETANGGGSLLGAGGAAGDISQFLARVQLEGRPDTVPALSLKTGQGGAGLTGGAGGSIIGRNDLNSADVQTNTSQQSTGDTLSIIAGFGGFGINAAGAGGSLSRVVTEFGGGNVDMQAGDGGNSSSGSGGAGGNMSVTPSPLLSRLAGALTLAAGDGGDGLKGGQGGGIVGFVNRPTDEENPTSVRAVAGDGGSGVSGAGGKGGSVSEFSATTSSAGGIALLISGRGGLSSAGIGGAGGDLSRATLTAEAGAAVGIAGAGGDGLRTGGAGGNLTSGKFKAGGLTDARVVVMAGAGGDGFGVSAATVSAEGSTASALYQKTILAIGTGNARGGEGGSIVNFTQPQTLKASVDLVAGNGGSTINQGLISDKNPRVGRGGSMTNINIANDVGIMDLNTPIRAYANDFAQQLRDGTVTQITPNTGNVGAVIGAAGRVRGDLPASAGVAGSVDGFKAQNIMSMVAGSVDRIAAITAVKSLALQNGGTEIGAAKNTYINPNNLTEPSFGPGNPRPFPTTYWSAPANNASPYTFSPGAQAGGDLLDGAIVTGTYSGPNSVRVFKGL